MGRGWGARSPAYLDVPLCSHVLTLLGHEARQITHGVHSLHFAVLLAAELVRVRSERRWLPCRKRARAACRRA